MRIPGLPLPTNSISLGSSYRVTRQCTVLRKPFTLMQDDTHVPTSIFEGTSLRQPAKMVSHSSKRRRSDASAHAFSGLKSDDTATSTFAITEHYPAMGAG